MKKHDPRRKRLGLVLLLLLLLLLLLRRCEDQPTLPIARVQVLSPIRTGPGLPVTATPTPPQSRLSRKDRPSYATEDPGPLPWIEDLRLQVATRSTRLAACFVGVTRPGALKWIAAVEPEQGRVSDQVLEPVLATEPLKREQRECVSSVLSEPVYRLRGEGDARSTPVRVSLVLEF
jgi:hypothetical protein